MEGLTLLTQFITEVRQNEKLWLLEAKPGLFAMLEDGDGNSYVPVWSSEEEAKENIDGDWEEYAVTEMTLNEFVGWLRELDEDKISIAVSPDAEGRILPVQALMMRRMILGGDEQQKSDRELVGEEFYDEEWAEPFPEDFEDDEEE